MSIPGSPTPHATASALRELEVHEVREVRAAFLAAMEAARDRSRQLAAGD